MNEDRGAAVVLLTMMLSACLVVVLAVAGVIRVAATRAQASTAADLAALAAVPGTDCLMAEHVAGQNGAELRSCRVEGADVLVEVSMPLNILGREGQVIAMSRAGPP